MGLCGLYLAHVSAVNRCRISKLFLSETPFMSHPSNIGGKNIPDVHPGMEPICCL